MSYSKNINVTKEIIKSTVTCREYRIIKKTIKK